MTLPNFLICGAQKAGTTALYNYLKQHPDIFMSNLKETDFFAKKKLYIKGEKWLEKHFKDHTNEAAVGEASTLNMVAPKAPKRIADTVPSARLLFLLRNPIERAYSQYYYYIYTGNADADASFHQVIREEQSDFRRDLIERGMYDRQLARFDPEFKSSQKKVILNRDLRRETTRTVQDVYSFLGVDPSFKPYETKRRNVTRYPASLSIYHWMRRTWKSIGQRVDTLFPQATDTLRATARDLLFSEEKPPMREEDRAYLREIYAEPNARLEERLDRDLSHWK